MPTRLSHLSQKDLDNLEYILDNSDDDVILKLSGSGFLSDSISKVRNWLSPCLCYSKTSEKTMKEFGNYPIKSMQIMRTPLSSGLLGAINVISFGKWFQLMKQFGFDKFYHLSLVANIDVNGVNKNIIIEKNEVVNVSPKYKTHATTEVVPVQMGNNLGKITINQLLKHTLDNVGDDKYFLYDPFTNNCQFFIRYILTSNGMYNKAAEKFLFQDISELVPKLPGFTRKTARAITDTSATATKLLGLGQENNRSNAIRN